MPSYTLQCGHRHDLTDCIKRASSLNLDRAICHVCKTPFSSVEACYLELVNTNTMTLAEFIQSEEDYLVRRAAELAALPPRPPSLPQCSGICRTGNKCTKVAMRSNGIYCNLHS
jgi:hypothetical protein